MPVINRPRVALITNVLAHYRVPCFEALIAQWDGDLDIFLLAGGMSHRQYVMASQENGLPVQLLKGYGIHRPPFDDRHINDLRPVMRGQYDVLILSGWDEPSYMLLWLYGVLSEKKLYFWIESTLYDGKRTGFKERYKKRFLKHVTGCIIASQRAGEYCQHLGVDPARLFKAPNATDRSYFATRAEQLVPKREQLRQAHQLSGFVILYVGRFVEFYKDLETVLRATFQLEKNGHDVTLVLIGSGTDRLYYEQLIAEHGSASVRFPGQMPHEELCQWYAMADVLVLPSKSETWGFVLNEGMEFSLPLLVSEAVGAAPDLVVDGENGYILPVGDVAAWQAKLEKLMAETQLRLEMGQCSQKHIQNFSPQAWAAGFVEALEGIVHV